MLKNSRKIIAGVGCFIILFIILYVCCTKEECSNNIWKAIGINSIDNISGINMVNSSGGQINSVTGNALSDEDMTQIYELLSNVRKYKNADIEAYSLSGFIPKESYIKITTDKNVEIELKWEMHTGKLEVPAKADGTGAAEYYLEEDEAKKLKEIYDNNILDESVTQ